MTVEVAVARGTPSSDRRPASALGLSGRVLSAAVSASSKCLSIPGTAKPRFTASQRPQSPDERKQLSLQKVASCTEKRITAEADAAGLEGSQRTGADACVRYLRTKHEFLRYDQALDAGWPIATGVIEGACRHLIADRLDITGARWGLNGAEAILTLRAVIANGDFSDYWQFHLEREHQRHYPGTSQRHYTLSA